MNLYQRITTTPFDPFLDVQKPATFREILRNLRQEIVAAWPIKSEDRREREWLAEEARNEYLNKDRFLDYED